MRYHLTPVRMAIIKMSTNSKCCCEGVEEREGSCTAGGNVSWHGRCGGQSVCTVLSCSGTFDSVTATLQPARLLSTGVLQASIVEWVAMPSSRGSSQPRDQTQVSCVVGTFFTHLGHQRSPRILEWAAYPFSWELPDLGIELGSPALQVASLPAELTGKPRRQYGDSFKN